MAVEVDAVKENKTDGTIEGISSILSSVFGHRLYFTNSQGFRDKQI